jgi:hypothetical protein
MARTFKVEITETTPDCRPSYPMTIEAPADSVSALIQSLAALPVFSRDGVDLVRMSREADAAESAA